MLSGSSKSEREGISATDSILKIGKAATNEIAINSEKHTRITKAENTSCVKGFISLKAVKIIAKAPLFLYF